jgi:serine protein kinase
MKWLEEVNKETRKDSGLRSFDEFMRSVERDTKRHTRHTSLWLKDMFDHFGKNQLGGFNLFVREHADAPPVNGQISVQKKIYSALKNFIEEGFNNKFLLLIGPNGSSKSSLIKKIMLAAEDYSATDAGELWSFSWVFPIDQYTKGTLGLSSPIVDKNLQTYALLEDKDIAAILTSELKDHPLLLIPIQARQRMLETWLSHDPQHLEHLKQTYLWNGDLSQRNRMIYDALLKNHKGHHEEVYKYIRVERLLLNRRYSRGATTIEPQLHVDANISQITMDRRLAALPPSLQSLNLFSIQGEVINANRGILEFSDLLKRPLDAFKYLLMTMESKTINIQGILTELDIFFIGSSNEIHFAAFKQHPDFNSFKGRFTFVRVPYLTHFREEEKIYQEQVKKHLSKGRFEPHALESLCLWAVMCRIRCSHQRNFSETKLGKIAEALSPLEKTLLYADHSVPEGLDSESKQILRLSVNTIENEFENDPMYEGKFGVSPREIKAMIYELSENHPQVTFVEVLEYLTLLSEKKQEYDFLNITPQGDYHHPLKHCELIRDYQLKALDNEVRQSLGLVDDRSYEDYISKYILQINAQIKGEKVKNNVTGKFEAPDSYFIKEFESNIAIAEKPEQFRSNLIAKLGAYALDNPGKPIVYTEIFDDLVRMLQEGFRKEQAKLLGVVQKNLVLYLAEKSDKKTHSNMTPEHREMIDRIINNLRDKCHYSEQGAISLLQYLLKNEYDASF